MPGLPTTWEPIYRRHKETRSHTSNQGVIDGPGEPRSRGSGLDSSLFGVLKASHF